MKIVKTAKLRITSHTQIFDATLSLYREALSLIIEVAYREWYDVSGLKAKEKINTVEALIHRTKSRPEVKYSEFNKQFYKFPSYLRRAAISEAIGIVSSHMSRLDNWRDKKASIDEKNLQRKAIGKRPLPHPKPPKLQLKHTGCPVFYRKEMFKKHADGSASIKIFKDNDWVWVNIQYQTKNLLSSNKYRFTGYKEQNPALVQKGKKYFLHIPYGTSVTLPKKAPDVVIGVDLGLNKSAVCSAVTSNGTVIGRLFIDQPVEKDRMKTAVGRLSKATRNSGIHNEKPNHWRRINNLQQSIVQQTVDQIVQFAEKHGADTIVFEHLGKMRLPKGIYGARRLRAKLQWWAKCKIQNKVKQKAHSYGIRFSRILARGTSKFAFDGSGEVTRTGRCDISTFSTGKQYHADLSASYNIAARYFIRQIIKPLPEMERSALQAKVPEIVERTKHTLATLASLSRYQEDCRHAA